VDILQGARELGRGGGGRRKVRVEPVQGPPDKGPPQALRHVGRAVVDAHDPAGMHRVGLLPGPEELGLGIFDAHLAAGGGDRSSEERGVLPGQRLDEGRIPVVPHDPHGARAVVGGGLDAEQAPPHPHRAHAVEAHEDRRRLAPFQGRHGGKSAAVLVAKRQREEKVADRPESFGRHPLGARRPDAWNSGDRVAEVKSVREGARRRRQEASGEWKVIDTRPNLRTSPPLSAMGTPVVSRLPLTYVPFMTPISSIT
jgi:hypothetical protein